jgi:hypothetical protein
MKKLAISVLLLLLCGNAMSADTKSDWRSFGSKPEEDKFLSGLESYVREYFYPKDPKELDAYREDLATCVADVIFLYKDGLPKRGRLPLFIPPEIRDFLDELLDNVSELESNYFKLKSGEQARKELIDKWSAHELLEKWKQEKEANGGLRVEKQVPDGYIRLKRVFGDDEGWIPPKLFTVVNGKYIPIK